MSVRVLLTGFGPFGDVVSNPTERLVRRFHGAQVGDRTIEGLALPTSFSRAKRLLAEAIAHDAVLMLGVAESATCFRVETLGRNRDEARIADVDGERPSRRIDEAAPDALEVTLDAARLRDAIGRAGLHAELSDSAGAYVCNHVLFSTLLHLRGSHVRAGFLHVPADAHTHDPPRTRLPFDAHVAAVTAALVAL